MIRYNDSDRSELRQQHDKRYTVTKWKLLQVIVVLWHMYTYSCLMWIWGVFQGGGLVVNLGKLSQR